MICEDTIRAWKQSIVMPTESRCKGCTDKCMG